MKVTALTTVLHEIDNLLIRNIPVTSTVVELDDKMLAIIDTGMYGNPGLLESLEEAGYSPLDFSLVINTHIHPDHVGGNRHFKNACILISRQELAYERDFAARLRESKDPAAGLHSMGRHVRDQEILLARELKKLTEAYPADKLVGDPEQLEFFEDQPLLPKNLSVVSVPGHSIGSRAVILQDKSRAVLVAGDALYHRDLWRKNSAGILHYNADLFMNNARRISRFRGIIIPGHDRAFDNHSRRYLEEDTFYL